MEYVCTLISVRDMERSKRFYCDLLGMTVTADFSANVTLSGQIALQTNESWQEFLGVSEKQIHFTNHAAELYFEEADLDSFLQKLAVWPGIEYVHPLKEHRWGQRVVRFYDPDGHIVEVGEKLPQVVLRFIKSGLSREETACRMDVPLAYVESCVRELTPV
ncbi:VOC family protein [Faecalispora anaeroviscerum]|uniref:VOC family protein n=1 Tax=Faecalispora anaeroviscerum TaxID=2991836 RepID=UPI0024BB3C30|nr:VOC family protein [Faecalispora anaeroviscerum]